MASTELGHVLVTWGRQFAPDLGFPVAIENRILESLSGRAFVRAHANALIVTITYDGEREEIVSSISEVLRENERVAEDPEPLLGLVVTPVLSRGDRHDGWLEPEIWQKINQRTG